MSISEISSSLLSELHFDLTSPFTHKKVVINAHTSYDEEQAAKIAEKQQEVEEIFNRGHFYSRDFATADTLQPNTVATAYSEFVDLEVPPEINYFEKEYSNEVYEKCLNNGYSAQEAVNVKNAYKAYGINENNYKNGVGIMSTQSCDV